MKAYSKPMFYPQGIGAPWGVDAIDRAWYVIHSATLQAKRIGAVGGRINSFDRAMAEAYRRNVAEQVKL